MKTYIDLEGNKIYWMY